MRAWLGVGSALLITSGAAGQQFFRISDGAVSFTKPAFADATDPANWDVITSAVAITRGDTRGIYNPIQEPFGFNVSESPKGTLWLFGSTVDDVMSGAVTLASFQAWRAAHGGNPPGTVGQDAVMYLTAEDAFVDIVFTDWGQMGPAGGRFSYTRAVVTLGVPAPGAAGPVIAVAAMALARRRRR